MPRVERGRVGAAKRWGPRRVVRLDALPPDVANVIRALVAASEAAKDQNAAAASGTG
jgi:hypothetical protein